MRMTRVARETRTTRRGVAGFTLLEMMMAVTIAAVLLAVAVPSFQQIMAKRRITSAAQALAGSIRKAQAEATRLNRTVEVLMTASAPDSANVVAATPTTPAASTGWMIRALNPTSAADYIGGDTRSRYGSITATGDLQSIAFTPMGRMIDYSTGAPVIPANYRILRFVDAGGAQRMCVYVAPGGSVRVCDPSAASGTTTSCVPALPAGLC